MSELAVEVVDVEPRPTAVIRETTSWPQLSTTIQRLLDQVWDVVGAEPRRSQLAHDGFGENVILYLDPKPTIEVGVLVGPSFEPAGPVELSSLPGGRVARAIHRGPYQLLGATHQEVRGWCEAHGHALAGISWEHYGDWHDDPAELETAIAYVLSV